MDTAPVYRIVDTGVFVIAALFNVLMIGIFLSRPPGLKRVERVQGWIGIALAVPAGVAVVLNALGQREWWTMVLPALFVIFEIVELVLDYILKLDFRHSRLLGPYLLLYYASTMGLIGYSFLVHKTYGFITLATYFLCLLATWYSYSKVGHGRRQQEAT